MSSVKETESAPVDQLAGNEKPLKRLVDASEGTNTPLKRGINESSEALEDKVSLPRLLQSDRPFLHADWEWVLFLHFVIEPEVLRAHVPRPFELELYKGQACMSVVAVTMKKFRPCRFDPVALPFCCLRQQRFLNLRTYVRWKGEPGAFFLHGWLSRPLGLPLMSNAVGLPYTFANSKYEHELENGIIRGSVRTAKHEFAYRGLVSHGEWAPAAEGSVAEFVMERYSGFFSRKGKGYVFRAWHPVWLQQSVDAIIERDDLIVAEFPEWRQARLVGASLAPGFPRVGLGKAHGLTDKAAGRKRRLTGTFFSFYSTS